jgi:hypothetical protein
MRTDDYMALQRGRLIRGGKFFCWHRWDTDEVHGAWRYRECAKCDERRVERVYSNLGGTLDWDWLETGEWKPEPTLPPKPPWTPTTRNTGKKTI